jgi:hypothetical protein
MRRNFARVASFAHWPTGQYSGWPEIRAGLKRTSQDTTIRETDFDYTAMPIAALNTHQETLNTVLVAHRPRRRPLPPHVDEFIPHAWCEGAIHAKVRREETELLRWTLWQATEAARAADSPTMC